MHHPLDYTDDDYTVHRPQVSQSREDAMFARQIDSGHWPTRKTDVSKLTNDRKGVVRRRIEARRAARLAMVGGAS